jgi:hypothetical protein
MYMQVVYVPLSENESFTLENLPFLSDVLLQIVIKKFFNLQAIISEAIPDRMYYHLLWCFKYSNFMLQVAVSGSLSCL